MSVQANRLPRIFCWSKMGVESGEALASILLRKDFERRLNGGKFFWGVGNSLGASIGELMRRSQNPTAIFTLMKSKPKQLDVAANSLRLWLTYFDQNGNEVELPKGTLLTSRHSTEAQESKKHHFALTCYAEKDISTGSGGCLNGSGLRNIMTGKPVGFSQVTSVVRSVGSADKDKKSYKIGFSSGLFGLGQVKLASYVIVDRSSLVESELYDVKGGATNWEKALDSVRNEILSRWSVHSPHRSSRGFEDSQLNMLSGLV